MSQKKLQELAEYVVGCFDAAETEGLSGALSTSTDIHLKDLVERRLMYAKQAAQDVLNDLENQ